MKKLLVLIGIFASLNTFASGKIILQGYNSMHFDENKIPSMIGLSVYEKLAGPIYMENFTSFANNTVEDFASGSKNFNSKFMTHLHFGNLIAGFGGQFVHYFNSEINDLRVIGQLSYKLW